MRYAIIADIHANLEALTAVLHDIERKGKIDELWCLGDVVGYGPDPGPCIEIIRRYGNVCVAGNHDLAVIGRVDTRYFNPHAAAAVSWTAKQLSPGNVQYLEKLPLTIEKGDFTLVHGSPMDPVFEYIISGGIAARNFPRFKTTYCLVGHSHQPVSFKEENGGAVPIGLTPGVGVILAKTRMIINPGAVGQPRDGDPQAAYMIFEDEASIIRLIRVPYDIETTQQKIMKAGLPVHLATRLKEGR
jgi:diadenosine tetraphosphatase ApaH/serine/threonine PP2A family protein phosphatase